MCVCVCVLLLGCVILLLVCFAKIFHVYTCTSIYILCTAMQKISPLDSQSKREIFTAAKTVIVRTFIHILRTTCTAHNYYALCTMLLRN